MMKKWIASLLMVLLLAAPTQAQLNLPYTTFQPGQTISSSQFTANFTQISANALNRTGGTMTGTLTLNAAVDVNSTFTIGSGNVQPFDSTGKIQAISSTYFASLSGANLTGIPETAIMDDSLLARVGGTETITGAWSFSTAPTLAGTNITSIPEAAIINDSLLARVGDAETITGLWSFSGLPTITNTAPTLALTETGVAANSGKYRIQADAGVFAIQAINDAVSTSSDVLYATRSGSTVNALVLGNSGLTVTVPGALSVAGALAVTGAQTFTGMTTTNGGIETTTFDASSSVVLNQGASSFANITFSNNFGITTGSGEFVQLGASTLTLGANSGSIVFSGGSFYPDGGGVGNGRTTDRWSTIYLTSSPDVSSDFRLKQDIGTIHLGLEFIDKLQPKEYRLKSDPATRRYGFIAQDLQALGFEGVSIGENGLLGLRYEELIAPIVKGLQELHQEHHLENLQLRAEIEMLKSRLDSLEKNRVAD